MPSHSGGFRHSAVLLHGTKFFRTRSHGLEGMCFGGLGQISYSFLKLSISCMNLFLKSWKFFVHRRKLGQQMYLSFIDGPYLVTLCCLLLPYTARIHKVEISVCPQMYLKKPAPIAESFWGNLEFLWIAKVHGQWGIRTHRSPSTLFTIKPRMTLKNWTSSPLSSFKCLRTFSCFWFPSGHLNSSNDRNCCFCGCRQPWSDPNVHVLACVCACGFQ